MANSKQIQTVAIIGTGVIGASWAALYLAHGLNITATDPHLTPKQTCAATSTPPGKISWSSAFRRMRRAIT
jgi:3-hydroxyacyl-CoA dehydrogenase